MPAHAFSNLNCPVILAEFEVKQALVEKTLPKRNLKKCIEEAEYVYSPPHPKKEIGS